MITVPTPSPSPLFVFTASLWTAPADFPRASAKGSKARHIHGGATWLLTKGTLVPTAAPQATVWPLAPPACPLRCPPRSFKRWQRWSLVRHGARER